MAVIIGEHQSLHCTEGTSNKVYHIMQLKINGKLFVAARYGKFGCKKLRNEMKQFDVSWEQDRFYNKMLQQKYAKGYRNILSSNIFTEKELLYLALKN